MPHEETDPQLQRQLDPQLRVNRKLNQTERGAECVGPGNHATPLLGPAVDTSVGMWEEYPAGTGAHLWAAAAPGLEVGHQGPGPRAVEPAPRMV